MDPGELIALLSILLGGAVVVVAFVGVWMLGREHGRKEALGERVVQTSVVEPLVDARLSRIERLVEGTSVEVERIAEGQRFTAKLLASRAETVEGRERAQR